MSLSHQKRDTRKKLKDGGRFRSDHKRMRTTHSLKDKQNYRHRNIDNIRTPVNDDFSDSDSVDEMSSVVSSKGKEKQKNSKHRNSMVDENYDVDDDDDDVSEEEKEDLTGNGESDDMEEEEEEDSYAAVREEISSLSFEELQQLKDKLGLKVFNQIMRGKRDTEKGKKIYKRENKNRPMEMSSKRPVPRYREVVAVKKKAKRDPRFDDLSGEFNPHIFSKTYSFISDIKSREKEVIKKKLKKEKDPEKKQELQYLLNRMKQQEMSEQQKQKKTEIEKEWKKREKEKVAKDGKTPYYLKKSDLRKLELAEKYKELKKTGKVEKYLSKKRKKTAQKEKKLLPT